MNYEEFVLAKIINSNVEDYDILLESVMQTSVAPSVYLKDRLTRQKVSVGLKVMFGELLHKSKNTSINFYLLKEYRTSILNIDTSVIKTCKKCGSELPITNFYANGYTPNGTKKYKPNCKKCSNSISKDRFRFLVLNSFGDYSCKICGYNKCEQALEFHHVNPEEKEFRLAEMLTYTEDKILKEFSKCLLVCANCHREIHYGFYTEYLK